MFNLEIGVCSMVNYSYFFSRCRHTERSTRERVFATKAQQSNSSAFFRLLLLLLLLFLPLLCSTWTQSHATFAFFAVPVFHPKTTKSTLQVCSPRIYSRAAAPEIISMSSVVTTACRVRLYWICNFSIISPALEEAFSIAAIRADCSEAAPWSME